MKQHAFPMIVLCAALLVTACAHPSPVKPSVRADLPEQDRSILAGEWIYEEGAAVPLRLDEEGNGTYAWKEGRFETTHFGGRTWMGKWYQQENDREGGFLVQLSPDYSEGEGTWWYVRIGPDPAPSQEGGTFHLTRRNPLTSLNTTPPAP